MRKLILLFFFMCLFYNCSSVKMEYYAVENVINDIKTPINSISNDTIELCDYQLNFNIGLLDGYKMQKDIVLNNRLKKSSSNLFKWVETKYEWILTDQDLDFMSQSIAENEKYLWSEKKFKNDKKVIKVIDYPMFFDHLAEDIERQRRIKSDRFVYLLSKPIFNLKKDIFIIQYEILLLPYSKVTLIYKKEKNKWIQIARMGSSSE